MPIKNITLLLLTIHLSLIGRQSITLMLDPAGDAKHAGRIIQDSFERGITLQFAEKLKKLLEIHDAHLRVILTRFPGESLEPLQNANFANRLNVDFYVSIHFFYEQETKPHLFLFYFNNNPTDIWIKHSSTNMFETFDKAHRTQLGKTKEYASSIKKICEEPRYTHLFEVKGPWGIPFKPLVGITCPAIALEGSLTSKNQWESYLDPLVQSLLHITQQMR